MQVFCPYANPNKTARCLDNKRLNKQILEVIQILSANTGINVGWKMPKYVYNHPNTLLWNYSQYNFYLIEYLRRLLDEYFCRKKIYHKCEIQYRILFNEIITWAYIPTKIKHLTPGFCKKHQQLLLEKDYEHYSKYF
jgi:hypothetical protein